MQTTCPTPFLTYITLDLNLCSICGNCNPLIFVIFKVSFYIICCETTFNAVFSGGNTAFNKLLRLCGIFDSVKTPFLFLSPCRGENFWFVHMTHIQRHFQNLHRNFHKPRSTVMDLPHNYWSSVTLIPWENGWAWEWAWVAIFLL